MKNIRLVLFTLVLVFSAISCSLFTPGNSKSASKVDFESPAQPINVAVQLDQAYSISDMISVDGGSLFLTAVDGSNFTLDVPANALEADTWITMTAVQSIEGAPLSDGAVAAVQLEPAGLFFNEIVTLTIVPAQEIPVEEQIIFGYEGDGQDYHLAVVDSNSREIKVKLIGFSGAGVGSGSDSAWAANLQVQANATRVRLDQKLGEYTQVERKAELLGSEGNPENSKVIRSYMDQYYDQIIRKEMVAAELDCQYAQKARQDLLALERQNQILVISGEDAEGYPNPFLDDIWEKIEKLAKIEAECKKAYLVNGTWGLSSITGEIDSLENPFTLTSSGGPGCTGEVQFSGGATGGTVSCAQTCGGLYFIGDGSYVIDITKDGGTISGGCSIYLPASGGLDITDEGPIEATLQLAP